MISLLKNNLSLIFNIGIVILLFTYPIDKNTEVSDKENNVPFGSSLKINNTNIQSVKDYNNSIINPTSNSKNIFETNNILFTKK